MEVNMENRKIRIQTIGSFLDLLKKYLEPENIVIESSITGCNPLAMEGKTDEQYIKYGGDINAQLRQVLNIRKNLSSMLSREPEKFCQNYNSQPMGQDVRLKNTSDYIIFMNTSTTTPIYERDGVVYSDLEGNNDFLKDLRSNKAYTKRTFPFGGDFSWKYYYDKFIDAILREYDNEHIILIKSNCAQWFMEKKNPGAFGDRSSHFRNLISEMDDYFIERTRCMVIDEHYNHIPPANHSAAWFPYIHMSQTTFKCLAKEITNIIYGIDSERYKPSVVKRGNSFARQLQLKLSSEMLRQHEVSINRIINDWLTLDEIKKLGNQNEFFNKLVKLEKFIDFQKPVTLSDYVVELLGDPNTLNGKVDIELVGLYTQFFKLDINDIIAIYKLYTVTDRKPEFIKIVGNVINNPDCIPVIAAKRFKDRNIRVLENYPYIRDEHKGKSANEIYIRLEENCFLVLNESGSECIYMLSNKIKDAVEHMKIIEEGLVCPVECADALTYSCDYYVEKARKGLGAMPTYLKFNSSEEFFDSLNYIDYDELLKNEKFVFIIGDEEIAEPSEYTPITDLTELMDPETVTIRMAAGLGDQITYYVMGQLVTDFSGRKVLYDEHCHLFNGCEILKLAKRPISFLSSKMSDRLNNIIGDETFEKLYYKISERSVFATTISINDIYKRYNAFYARKCYKDLITLKMPYMHLYGILHPYNWREYFDFSLKDYIEFPPLEREEHMELVRKMRSCDSVVIHIRRGDYLAVYQSKGQKANYNFYIEAIKKLLSIPDYPNKKYFVFSDDIPWCKTHLNEIGLDLVGNSEIIFVDGNKFDESFRDMQLMTYGKIMIGGHSGFFNVAAQYNEDCEIFLGSVAKMRKIKKNKYDVGEFTEKYIVDI